MDYLEYLVNIGSKISQVFSTNPWGNVVVGTQLDQILCELVGFWMPRIKHYIGEKFCLNFCQQDLD